MRLRPDLLGPGSPEQIQVVQLTTEADVPSSHVYMEAQIFAPDSRRFLLHRSAYAHGSSRRDAQHQYLRCDLDDGCSLHPVTEELSATAPSLSPDGEWVYYLVDETAPAGGRLTLKRVRLDGTERTTLRVLDQPLLGTDGYLSRVYPLSTISPDGQRLAIAGFLGDGQEAEAPFGLIVFDLATGEASLVLHGPSWCNLHPQYTRSTDPADAHDILVQENHGNEHDASGAITKLTGGDGADIHLLRDDGTDLRDLPWGRQEGEHCQGHQCWRGRSPWAITSTGGQEGCRLIESRALPHLGHVGRVRPDGVRNDISRDVEAPSFWHFACDADGRYLISDGSPRDGHPGIFAAVLAEPGAGPARRWWRLLDPRSSWRKQTHPHPFLSPDGSAGFFNSDESGQSQAYMITGLDALWSSV